MSEISVECVDRLDQRKFGLASWRRQHIVAECYGMWRSATGTSEWRRQKGRLQLRVSDRSRSDRSLVAITVGQPRVMAIERGSALRSGPLEQGHRLNSTHSTDISTAFRIIADTELIPNHLFAAANLIYTADIAKAPGEDRESASEFDATAVLAQ